MKKIFLILMGLVAANAFAVTPADPTNLTWYDCGNESGDSYLTFTLPTVDVNGNPLDIEMMGYRIYTDDDQIFTFNSAQYENVWGSTTDIYYYNWDSGSELQSNGVYFYRTNADGFERFFNTRIGVQVFYLNDNFGIGGVSNIVYTYLDNPVADLPKPMMPIIDEWWDSDGGFSQIGIFYNFDWDEFLPMAVDSTCLDTEKLSLSVFTDNDQLFEFTPEEYPGEDFTETVTEIPYGYEGLQFGMWEIHFPNHSNMTEGMDRFFNWRIGLRLNYRDGDQVSYSDIYYMEVFPQLQEAKNVTSTSFLADWSCDDPNTHTINNFINDDDPTCGYNLYIIDVANNDTTVIYKVNPTNWTQDGNGNPEPLAGATYQVEGLTPGATYQFYVEEKQNTGKSYLSVVREVTLPGEQTHLRGDVNHDHDVTIADVSALIDYLLDSENSDACTICADTNLDTEVTIADVSALIDYLLNGAW